MQQVKLFRQRTTEKLEEEINTWIRTNQYAGTLRLQVLNVSISEDENGLTGALLFEGGS
jgi:hypothetical protein